MGEVCSHYIPKVAEMISKDLSIMVCAVCRLVSLLLFYPFGTLKAAYSEDSVFPWLRQTLHACAFGSLAFTFLLVCG